MRYTPEKLVAVSRYQNYFPARLWKKPAEHIQRNKKRQ